MIVAGCVAAARWAGFVRREAWAIGFGLNVTPPDLSTATGLPPGRTRIEALSVLVPALRGAADARGHLSDGECSRWSVRDVARGRPIARPAVGIVEGISPMGELLVRGPDDSIARHRTGSLTFAEPLACS